MSLEAKFNVRIQCLLFAAQMGPSFRSGKNLDQRLNVSELIGLRHSRLPSLKGHLAFTLERVAD